MKDGRWVELRKRAGGQAISALFEGLAAAGRLHPKARPAAHGLEVVRDVVYGPTEAPHHRLDVWRPRDLSPGAPALLFIHGGGFRILSKDSHWLMALMFARAGYVVFSINYRLAPAHPFPAAFEDAASAFVWLVENAAAYGADARRLAVSGESAGANLTLGLALAACTERPEPFARRVWETGVAPAVILPNCGLLQVTEAERFAAERKINTLIRDRIQQVCAGYLGDLGTAPRPETALADPLCLVERGPRPARPFPATYLSVGTADPIESDTPRLARALERWGVKTRLDVYPGETHAFHAFIWRAAARRCWDAQLAFLGRHLPPGERTAPAEAAAHPVAAEP